MTNDDAEQIAENANCPSQTERPAMTDMNKLRDKVARAITCHFSAGECAHGTPLEVADAAIATVQEAGWQDIATAPKDGSNILIIAMKAYSAARMVGWHMVGVLLSPREVCRSRPYSHDRSHPLDAPTTPAI